MAFQEFTGVFVWSTGPHLGREEVLAMTREGEILALDQRVTNQHKG